MGPNLVPGVVIGHSYRLALGTLRIFPCAGTLPEAGASFYCFFIPHVHLDYELHY